MTNNGLAALAAALHEIHAGPRPWPGGMTSADFAAAILGRGVFLPDGLPDYDVAYAAGVEDGKGEQAATLRAALDGLVEPLGEWLIEMMERNLTPAEATLYDALRAALATTKEAGGG